MFIFVMLFRSNKIKFVYTLYSLFYIEIILFLTAFGLSMALSAQTKITFEDAEIASTGGAIAMWGGGSVDVVANTYTTGNASANALHVLNTNYLPIYFENVAIPAGAETVLSKIKVKFLIIGGT